MEEMNLLVNFRYFPNCRNMASCPFKHDLNNPYNTCAFFLKGACRFGDNCR